MKKTENRSVRKTKLQIKQSFIQLLKKKPTSKITVKELCELADINRGTFYFHYQDIYSLLNEMVTDCTSEFDELINRNMNDDIDLIHSVLEICENNHDFIDLMIENKTCDPHLNQSLRQICEIMFSLCTNELTLPSDSNQAILINSFLIGGFMSALYRSHELYQSYSSEEFYQFIHKMLHQGFLSSIEE